MEPAATAAVLRTSVLIILYFSGCLAVPLPCDDIVGRLQSEVEGLKEVIDEQHRYIQELHHSQARLLENIPNAHLGPHNKYRDCSEVYEDGNIASGLYVVRPDGSPMAFTVFCDMNNGGGWTVFQRRRNGQESFDRGWVEYKQGFGDLYSPDGEFWLGNEPLHYLTSQGKYDMRVDMEDFEGKQHFAEYNKFQVDGEKDDYQLHLGQYMSDDAGNAMTEHQPPLPADVKWSGPESAGVKFITYDHPGDDPNCVTHDKSGWWFSRCESGDLNGHHFKGPYQAMTEDGVVWYTWHGWWYSLKSVVMMVRAADLEDPPPVVEQFTEQLYPGNDVELPPH